MNATPLRLQVRFKALKIGVAKGRQCFVEPIGRDISDESRHLCLIELGAVQILGSFGHLEMDQGAMAVEHDVVRAQGRHADTSYGRRSEPGRLSFHDGGEAARKVPDSSRFPAGSFVMGSLFSMGRQGRRGLASSSRSARNRQMIRPVQPDRGARVRTPPSPERHACSILRNDVRVHFDHDGPP